MQNEELEEKVNIMEELIQGFAGRISVMETSMAEFLKSFLEQYRGTLEMIATRIETANKHISKDRYEMFGGVNMFFYDQESIEEEFGRFGLLEITEITENYPFYMIKCKKDQQIDK